MYTTHTTHWHSRGALHVIQTTRPEEAAELAAAAKNWAASLNLAMIRDFNGGGIPLHDVAVRYHLRVMQWSAAAGVPVDDVTTLTTATFLNKLAERAFLDTCITYENNDRHRRALLLDWIHDGPDVKLYADKFSTASPEAREHWSLFERVLRTRLQELAAAPLHFTETRSGLLQLAEQVELHVYRYERVWMTLEEIEAQQTRWRDWMDRERLRRKSLAVRGAVALPPPHSTFSNAYFQETCGQLLRDPLRDLGFSERSIAAEFATEFAPRESPADELLRTNFEKASNARWAARLGGDIGEEKVWHGTEDWRSLRNLAEQAGQREREFPMRCAKKIVRRLVLWELTPRTLTGTIFGYQGELPTTNDDLRERWEATQRRRRDMNDVDRRALKARRVTFYNGMVRAEDRERDRLQQLAVHEAQGRPESHIIHTKFETVWVGKPERPARHVSDSFNPEDNASVLSHVFDFSD